VTSFSQSTNRGLVHWRSVVQQWTDPLTWIKIVERSTVLCSEARYSSRIAFFAYPTCILDAPVRGVSVGISPSRLAQKNKNGLATRCWNNFKNIFIHFDATHERDGHTHRHTPHDGIYRPRLCIASRGKRIKTSSHLAFFSYGSRKYCTLWARSEKRVKIYYHT